MAYTTPISGAINQLVNAAQMNLYVRDNLANIEADPHRNFPNGGIVAWPFTLGSLPANWQHCDGTNGTPELLDKLIPGAGVTYAVNATGGAPVGAPTNHTNHVVTQMAAHTAHASVVATHRESTAGQADASVQSSNPFHGVTGDHPHTGAAVSAHSTEAHKYQGSSVISVMPSYKAAYWVQKLNNGAGAWSVPHTFTDGDVPTASQLNILIRDLPNFLKDQMLVPGGVIGWHGSIATIPEGFGLCDGVSQRPNYLDRFILGASGTNVVNSEGGVTGITYDAHDNHIVTQPVDHATHTFADHSPGQAFEKFGAPFIPYLSNGPLSHTGGSISGAHSHTNVNFTGGHTHTSMPILPPYYAIAFIQAQAGLWTTPKTWVDGDLFSASDYNKYIRDNIVVLRNLRTLQFFIAVWNSSIATIPAGWGRTNGTSGTLNLENSFLIGAGSTYAVGATGGALSAISPAHSAHSVAQALDHGEHVVVRPTNTHPTTNHRTSPPIFGYENTGDFNHAALIDDAWKIASHSVHTGGAIDPHSVHSSVATLPPYRAQSYMERTS